MDDAGAGETAITDRRVSGGFPSGGPQLLVTCDPVTLTTYSVLRKLLKNRNIRMQTPGSITLELFVPPLATFPILWYTYIHRSFSPPRPNIDSSDPQTSLIMSAFLP